MRGESGGKCEGGRGGREESSSNAEINGWITNFEIQDKSSSGATRGRGWTARRGGRCFTFSTSSAASARSVRGSSRTRLRVWLVPIYLIDR